LFRILIDFGRIPLPENNGVTLLLVDLDLVTYSNDVLLVN